MFLAAASTSQGGSLQASSGRILVVDDELFIRTSFQLYLETVGYSVQLAESGEKAMEIFASPALHPEVVILDLMMPGIKGIEVLKAIKAWDPAVEVIIATGCGSMGSAIEALRHGAFDYITKPIVNFDQDLLKVVREALQHREEKRRGPNAAAEVDAGRGGPPESSALLARLVEVACAVNRFRRGEPVLERIEDLLRKHFLVAAGVVLRREPAGSLTPVYSWGFSGPFAQGNGRLPGPLQNAAERGLLARFPPGALDGTQLAIPPEDMEVWRELAVLPLYSEGDHWGTLLAFFGEGLPIPLAQVEEKHPFQVLSALLGSAFAGALRKG